MDETIMTADDHTAAALHSMLDACLAEDSAGHEKAKKMAKAMKAMMGKEEAAEPAKEEVSAEAAEAAKEAAEAERQEQLFGYARLEQTVGSFAHPQIDRDKGVLKHVHIAGMESRTDGARYRLAAHQKAAPRFEQMPVGLDHNYASTPMKIGEAWGVLKNITVESDGPYGDLHYMKSHERTEQILEDAERGTGIFSLSMVAKTRGNGLDIDEYIPSRVDCVVRGATTKTLWNQEQTAVVATVPEVAKKQFDALALRFEQQQDEIAELKKRVAIKEKVVTPGVRLEQEIKKVEASADIDLRKFWDTSIPATSAT